jgi:hypothetical protein
MPKRYFGCWNRTYGDLSSTETCCGARLKRRSDYLADVRILVERHLPKEYARNSPGANSRGKRAAEARKDVAEVSTALRIVLQGQEELD